MVINRDERQVSTYLSLILNTPSLIISIILSCAANLNLLKEIPSPGQSLPTFYMELKMVLNSNLPWTKSNNTPSCAGGQVFSGLPSCKRARRIISSNFTEITCFCLIRYYVDPPSVVICGKPSASLADKLEADEKARVAQQVERLGPDGLKQADKELKDAKAEHDKPIPSGILMAFPVPDVKSISWIQVQSVQERGKGREIQKSLPPSADLAKFIEADGSPLPVFVQYDHVQVRIYSVSNTLPGIYALHLQSDFVSIHAIFSLANLPDRLRPYGCPLILTGFHTDTLHRLISTYLSAFFSLPVKRQSGERLTHEEVVNKLDNETVSYEVGLGISNSFTDAFRISIKVETALYDNAVAWMKDLLHGAEFDKDR